MDKYKLIAICGKSAAGKDTLLQGMLEVIGNEAHEVISHTTRPPREGEVNGKNYHFIDDYHFTLKEMKGQMLEVASYREWRYGTAIDALDKDKINIGVFNRKGIESLEKQSDKVDVYIVYMTASSKTRLLRSLHREENPDVDEIVRRYLADEKEWSGYIGPNFIVSNDGDDIGYKRMAEITDRIIDDAKRHWANQAN